MACIIGDKRLCVCWDSTWGWNCANVAAYQFYLQAALHPFKSLQKVSIGVDMLSEDKNGQWHDISFSEEREAGALKTIAKTVLPVCLKQCLSDTCSAIKRTARDTFCEWLL